MDNSATTPGLAHWLIILVLGGIWGSAFMAMELALDGFGPFWVAALRTGLAVPVLFALLTISGQSFSALTNDRAWRFVIPVGVFGMAIPFFFLSWGQQYVPSAFAGIAMGSLPIVLVPLAYVLLPDEKISIVKITGLVVGFAGLVLLVGTGGPTEADNEFSMLGRIACIGATVGYAIASVITRRSPEVPALVFSCGALSVASLLLIPLALIFEGIPNNVPTHALWAVIYAALFPTALAAYWRVLVIKSAGSIFMSLVAYLVPAFSVVFGVLILGETLELQSYIALLLILSGIGFSQKKALKIVLGFNSKSPP